MMLSLMNGSALFNEASTKACIPLESAFASADFCVANAEKGAQTT